MLKFLQQQKLPAFLVCGLIVLGGCTGINTLPHIARAGDTVMMALGTIDGITRQNVNVTYTPDTGGSFDLTPNIHALFKLYGDPTSEAVLDNTWQTVNSGHHEPWLWTMAVTLPTNLTTGTGSVNVSCTPRNACKFPSNYPHVNDVDMGLEILPGTGTPNPFKYQSAFGFQPTVDPTALEPGIQAALTPVANGILDTVKFGACEITLNMPTETGNGAAVPDQDYFVIPQDLTSVTRSQRTVHWVRNADQLKIIMASPHGFTFHEVRMSIVLDDPTIAGTDPAHVFTVAPTVTSVKYYDINGALLSANETPGASISLLNN